MSDDPRSASVSVSAPSFNIPNGAPVVSVTTPQTGQIIPTYGNAEGAQIQTQFKMELNQDSLVAITVAEAEKQIRTILGEKMRAKTEQDKTLRDLQTLQTKSLEDWTRAQSASDPHLTPLRESLSKYFRLSTITHSSAIYNPRTRTLNGSISFSWDGGSFVFSYEDTAPASYLSLLDEMDKTIKEINRLNNEILGARSALSNVDALERQAKASMAARIAQDSGAVGKALVEGLLATVNGGDLIERYRF